MLLALLLHVLFSLLPKLSSFCFHPFRVFGMNPILIYMLTGAALTLLWMLPSPEAALFPRLWGMTVKGIGGIPFSIFLFTVLWCSCWWGLAEYLYRRRIFIKI
jgi:predicted acyltransferase